MWVSAPGRRPGVRRWEGGGVRGGEDRRSGLEDTSTSMYNKPDVAAHRRPFPGPDSPIRPQGARQVGSWEVLN